MKYFESLEKLDIFKKQLSIILEIHIVFSEKQSVYFTEALRLQMAEWDFPFNNIIMIKA